MGRLADHAFPELQVEARELLAIDQYFRQLKHLQVAFSVKQKRPERLDDAVAATLEMDTNVLGGPGGGVTVYAAQDGKVPVTAISATGKMDIGMKKLVQQVESLESKLNQQSSTYYGCAEKDQLKEDCTSPLGPHTEREREPINQSTFQRTC